MTMYQQGQNLNPFNPWIQQGNANCSPLLRPVNNRPFNKGPVHERLGNRKFSMMPQNHWNETRFNLKRKSHFKTQQKRFSVNSPYQSTNYSVQERMQRIRNPNMDVKQETQSTYVHGSESSVEMDRNGDFDEDVPDLTVQVVNPLVTEQSTQELKRFKLVLNEKHQNSIKKIQSKRKEKQIVFPYPVTPNTTSVTLNQRFSDL